MPKPFENDPVAAALPHGTVYAHTDSQMLLLCCPIRHVLSFSVDKSWKAVEPLVQWHTGGFKTATAFGDDVVAAFFFSC